MPDRPTYRPVYKALHRPLTVDTVRKGRCVYSDLRSAVISSPVANTT